MLADGRLHAEFFKKLHGVVLEPGLDDRAAGRFGLVGLGHGVGAKTVAGPGVGRDVIAKSRARGDGNLVGYHKDGIKAYAKAADNIGGVSHGFFALGAVVGPPVAGFGLGGVFGRDVGQKLLGTGFGYGAQVFGQFLCRHAKAGIGDGEGFGVLIKGYAYLQRQVGQLGAFAAIDAKAQLVQRVRGVGNEFTQENLTIGIQRVGQDV